MHPIEPAQQFSGGRHHHCRGRPGHRLRHAQAGIGALLTHPDDAEGMPVLCFYINHHLCDPQPFPP